MKRNILYTGLLVAGMTLWTSCDHEPDFPGLDVKGESLTNVAKYADTYPGAAFNADNLAKETLPEWLLKKYYTCDKGSSAMVTYKYTPSIPEYVSAVSAATTYTVTAENYQTVWGDMPFTYFSPSNKATQYVPEFLSEVIETPVDNQLVVVNYNQADTDGSFDGQVIFEDDLESNSLDSWKTVVMSDESNNTNNWRVGSFDDNHYLQATAFNTKAEGLVSSYLISAKKIDITDAKMKLSFDALYANYQEAGGRLTVYLSENLAGFTKSDVEAATWTNITSSFNINTSPSGSGDLAPVGEYSMAGYAGNIKAVGFKLAEDKFMAIELQKSTTGWTSTSDVVEMTDEYEFDGAAWVYKRTVPKAALNLTFDEDGRKITAKDPTMIEGWLNIALGTGGQPWYDKSYNKNNYTECTAYGVSDGPVDSWMITPVLEIKSNYILTFDMTSGHWTHDALHVYISTTFSGDKEDLSADDVESTWKEVTENFNLPQVVGKYGTSVNVGSYPMTEYVGQQVYIAFRYLGDKAENQTSTVQLDNIYVGE